MTLQLVEADNLWLKKSDSEKRSVKMSLVRQHKPELIRMFEQEQRDKLVKKSKGGPKKAAAKVTVSACCLAKHATCTGTISVHDSSEKGLHCTAG